MPRPVNPVRATSTDNDPKPDVKEAPLPPYTHVEACGLKRVPELNGQHGYIVRYNPSSDRYIVIFNWDANTKKALKRINVKVVEDVITPPSWGGARRGANAERFGLSQEYSLLLRLGQGAFDKAWASAGSKDEFMSIVQRDPFINRALSLAHQPEGKTRGDVEKMWKYIMFGLKPTPLFFTKDDSDSDHPSVVQCKARFHKEFVHRFQTEFQEEIDEYLSARKDGYVKKKYEVRELGNPGKKHFGVFATEAIEPLEFVIVEDPILSVKLQKGQRFARSEQVVKAFNELSPEQQKSYRELQGSMQLYVVGEDGNTLEPIKVSDDEELFNIFSRNSISRRCGSKKNENFCAQHLYLDISRLNHSCSPNVFISYPNCIRALKKKKLKNGGVPLRFSIVLRHDSFQNQFDDFVV